MQYAVIQALQVGLGILLGVYLMSWVADRYGRRPAILLATLLGGICIWPFAYVTNFWGMVVLSVLSTLGVGGIVATHSVYLSEMTSPDVRNRVLLASQGVTALVAVGVNLLAFWLIPGALAGCSVGQRRDRDRRPAAAAVLATAGIAALAGGARPARRGRARHGRYTSSACSDTTGMPLPANRRGPAIRWSWRARALEGDLHQPAIPRPHHGADVCWLLGYAGLIYGVGAFAAVYMVDHGADRAFRVPDDRGRLCARCSSRSRSMRGSANRSSGATCYCADGDAVRGVLGRRLVIPT